MQLTLYTDYSLRVLIYLGLNDDELATISEIATAYSISRNHLVKVVHNLAHQGFIQTSRGKGGGMRLARPASQISLADVVRQTEPGFNLVECFDDSTSACPIDSMCILKKVLQKSSRAFMTELERYTLADILGNRQELRIPLQIGRASP